MTELLHTMPIDGERAMVALRRVARELSEALGFAVQDRTRIATSALEVARIVLAATRGGRAEFLFEQAAGQTLTIRFVAPATPLARCVAPPFGGAAASAPAAGLSSASSSDSFSGSTSSGEADAELRAPMPASLGVLAAQRLMDACSFEEIAGDAILTLQKVLPPYAPRVSAAAVAAAMAVASSRAAPAAPNGDATLEEVQRQNRELAGALSDLQERSDELARLTRELEDTNRGVVALYAELDERALHLRRADEAKSRFLHNMSHEFRSPLYSIRALSKLLIDRVDGDLTDEQAKQVRFIRKAAEELSETVDDLLDIAKIEAGKIEVRAVEFEVANLFSALRGMLRPLLPASGVELVFEPCGEIPPVYTDEGKVAQILRNFISNALKFTERGEVRVSAQYDAANQRLTFSVSDTGIGIAPEHQLSVFEEFEQVESHLQNQVKGTGLGLPLCDKLCKLLGGSVGLVSELGRGSTFTATIPVALRHDEGVPKAETRAETRAETPAEAQAGPASAAPQRPRPDDAGEDPHTGRV